MAGSTCFSSMAARSPPHGRTPRRDTGCTATGAMAPLQTPPQGQASRTGNMGWAPVRPIMTTTAAWTCTSRVWAATGCTEMAAAAASATQRSRPAWPPRAGARVAPSPTSTRTASSICSSRGTWTSARARATTAFAAIRLASCASTAIRSITGRCRTCCITTTGTARSLTSAWTRASRHRAATAWAS